MSEKLNVLEARKDKSRVGVFVYLEDDDIGKLDVLVKKTQTNRSDIMRQALRKIFELEEGKK